MVFFEVISHAIALDFGFFVEFILANLFWLFTYYTVMHFFFNGKRVLYFTLLFGVLMWAWSDFQTISGLYWTVPSFLLIYYITKLAIVSIVDTTPFLKKYTVVISTLQFYVLFLIFNFFIR